MSILDYPKYKCACGSDTWWYRAPEWICGICHPPPEEVNVIKMRMIKGTYLLNQAQIALRKLPYGSPERIEAFQIWDKGTDKLAELSKQLRALLPKCDCLYIEGGKKVKHCVFGAGDLECFTCPNTYWLDREIIDNAERSAKNG